VQQARRCRERGGELACLVKHSVELPCATTGTCRLSGVTQQPRRGRELGSERLGATCTACGAHVRLTVLQCCSLLTVQSLSQSSRDPAWPVSHHGPIDWPFAHHSSTTRRVPLYRPDSFFPRVGLDRRVEPCGRVACEAALQRWRVAFINSRPGGAIITSRSSAASTAPGPAHLPWLARAARPLESREAA
jgi:hypothetical protein